MTPIASARASTTDRGYGNQHQRERKKWQHRLDRGEQLLCVRCQQAPLIDAESTWDLGHNDDRTAWTGPEHVNCNRSAGAKNSNAGQRMTVRDW